MHVRYSASWRRLGSSGGKCWLLLLVVQKSVLTCDVCMCLHVISHIHTRFRYPNGEIQMVLEDKIKPDAFVLGVSPYHGGEGVGVVTVWVVMAVSAFVEDLRVLSLSVS